MNKYIGDGAVNNRMAGRLVARYVSSGNTVIQPTSANLTTGVFTVGSSLTALGFTVGAYYGTMFNIHSFATKILPKEIVPATDYFMYVLSDTTFQLSTSNTSAGLISSYPDASNTGVDPTQWHLEYASASSTLINLAGMGLSDIRVKIDCQGDRGGWRYVYLQGTSVESSNVSANMGTVADGRETMSLLMELHWIYSPETKTLWGYCDHQQNVLWGNNTSGTWTQSSTASNSTYTQTRPLTNFKITGVLISFSITNGSVIEIYDMKGGY